LKIAKNKTAATAIAIFFILSMTGSMMLAPIVKGQITAIPGVAVGTIVPTYLYLNVAPNPIGVGQEVNVNAFFGEDMISNEIPDQNNPQNYNVTVTTPSGTTETKTLIADRTGGGHVSYYPTTVGTYKFQANYGGQVMETPGYVGLIQGPAQSTVVSLTVQQTPVTFQAYPTTPLPNSWWENPVSAENSNLWYQLMGPNLFQQEYNATTWANPTTASVLSGHVLWTKPWGTGGVVGGLTAGASETSGHYWTTRQYEDQLTPIIISGRMYAEYYPETTGYSDGIVCWDLFNGQTLFTINTTSTLQFGMVTNYYTPNAYGSIGPYIWTLSGIMTMFGPIGPITWNMYSGTTGLYTGSITGGTGLFGLHEDANGNIIGYYTNSTPGIMSIWTPQQYLFANPTPGTGLPTTLKSTVTIAPGQTMLCEFNFTQALWDLPGNNWEWAASQGFSIDFRVGTMWAMPIPTTLNGKAINPALSEVRYTGDEILFQSYMDPAFFFEDGWAVYCAMNANTGAVSWIANWTYPTYQSLLPWARSSIATYLGGLYCNDIYVLLNYHNWVMNAFSCTTGNLVWTQTLKTPYGSGQPNLYDEVAASINSNLDANGQFVVVTFGGDIWDVNVTNGNTLWYTNTTTLLGPSGIETPYNIWPIWTAFSCQTMTDNVLYACIGHAYNPPMFHGAQIMAINMTNGHLIWKELDFGIMETLICEGVLTSLNCYDELIYGFGKGPSQVTVTAPDIGVTTATPITITGTVMDVSPGTKQEQQALDFPTGVPCVSDASESAFMEYVYQDQPEPLNATGVPVTLTETDHNGNTYTIGTTTTDSSGTFAYQWTPPIVGNYTIVATFAGSNSYYGQCAETHTYAGAPASSPAPAASPPSGLASTTTVCSTTIIGS